MCTPETSKPKCNGFSTWASIWASPLILYFVRLVLSFCMPKSNIFQKTQENYHFDHGIMGMLKMLKFIPIECEIPHFL